MALARSRRGDSGFNYWPGFVDALSTLILAIIFLLSVFAEIYVTTSGGPGLASTNLAFLIYLTALREYDVGGASAGGVIAVILANIVAVFLVRSIAKNITD